MLGVLIQAAGGLLKRKGYMKLEVLIQATGGLLRRKGYMVVSTDDAGHRRTPEEERIHGYWNC